MRNDKKAFSILMDGVSEAVTFCVTLGEGTTVAIDGKTFVASAKGFVSNARDTVRDRNGGKIGAIPKGEPFNAFYSVVEGYVLDAF